jgi:hypothetical protein
MYKNFSSGKIDLVGKAINEFLDNSDMIANVGIDFVPEHTYFGMESTNNNGVKMIVCINYIESDKDFIDAILSDINHRL